MLQLEHTNIIEREIQVEEIKHTISLLKINKSPGLDGFTSEFCKKKFGERLGTRLLEVFNECLKGKDIPKS